MIWGILPNLYNDTLMLQGSNCGFKQDTFWISISGLLIKIFLLVLTIKTTLISYPFPGTQIWHTMHIIKNWLVSLDFAIRMKISCSAPNVSAVNSLGVVMNITIYWSRYSRFFILLSYHENVRPGKGIIIFPIKRLKICAGKTINIFQRYNLTFRSHFPHFTRLNNNNLWPDSGI